MRKLDRIDLAILDEPQAVETQLSGRRRNGFWVLWLLM